jgi:hypothetical protein
MGAGHITLPPTFAWINYGTPARFMTATLETFEIHLRDPSSVEGEAFGRLSAVVGPKGVPSLRTIDILGTVTLVGEHALPDASADGESTATIHTTRIFRFSVRLASTPERAELAEQDPLTSEVSAQVGTSVTAAMNDPNVTPGPRA